MKKKMAFLLLILVILFGLAACGGNSNQDHSNERQTNHRDNDFADITLTFSNGSVINTNSWNVSISKDCYKHLYEVWYTSAESAPDTNYIFVNKRARYQYAPDFQDYYTSCPRTFVYLPDSEVVTVQFTCSQCAFYIQEDLSVTDSIKRYNCNCSSDDTDNSGNAKEYFWILLREYEPEISDLTTATDAVEETQETKERCCCCCCGCSCNANK